MIPEAWVRRPWIVRFFIWWHRYRFNFHYLETVNNLLVYECGYIGKNNLCSIYKWRPRLCREHPNTFLWGFPRVHKGCGFYFTKRGQKDFQEILKKEQK